MKWASGTVFLCRAFMGAIPKLKAEGAGKGRQGIIANGIGRFCDIGLPGFQQHFGLIQPHLPEIFKRGRGKDLFETANQHKAVGPQNGFFQYLRGRAAGAFVFPFPEPPPDPAEVP